LASQQQSFSLITVVFSIDISPPISIIPQLSTPLSPQGPLKPGSTPVGTPRPGVSPDPGSLTPAATPSEVTATEAVIDADAHLVDTTDDTWAIILAHRLNLKSGLREHRQSLASGLLIKVPPPTSSQNPFNAEEILDPSRVPCIAVHLLWGRNQGKLPDNQDKAWNHPSTVSKGLADSLLREFLILFRNLALLAKVRDIKDWKGGLVPWHVLIASKAVDGLDAVYGMEKW
jgi:mediator of RNA polymerase II transcription subunit 13